MILTHSDSVKEEDVPTPTSPSKDKLESKQKKPHHPENTAPKLVVRTTSNPFDEVDDLQVTGAKLDAEGEDGEDMLGEAGMEIYCSFIFLCFCKDQLTVWLVGRTESIHLRIQQRNGRKTITVIEGLPKEYDLKKFLSYCQSGS